MPIRMNKRDHAPDDFERLVVRDMRRVISLAERRRYLLDEDHDQAAINTKEEDVDRRDEHEQVVDVRRQRRGLLGP